MLCTQNVGARQQIQIPGWSLVEGAGQWLKTSGRGVQPWYFGERCISGSTHVDHRSETVEIKSMIHMIPSIWGPSRAGTQFPSIAWYQVIIAAILFNTTRFLAISSVSDNDRSLLLSDPGPFIVYPSQWLTHSLTKSQTCWRFNELTLDDGIKYLGNDDIEYAEYAEYA